MRHIAKVPPGFGPPPTIPCAEDQAFPYFTSFNIHRLPGKPFGDAAQWAPLPSPFAGLLTLQRLDFDLGSFSGSA